MGDASEDHHHQSPNANTIDLPVSQTFIHESFEISYEHVFSKSLEMENNLIVIQNFINEILHRHNDLARTLEHRSIENANLRIEKDEILRETLENRSIENEKLRIEKDEILKEKEDLESRLRREEELLNEIRVLRIDRDKKSRVLNENSNTVKSIGECLGRITERIGLEKPDGEDEGMVEEELGVGVLDDDDSRKLLLECKGVYRIAVWAESKLMEHDKMVKKEKKELEDSVVSLTEENRDITTLLRVALVEKEAAEKTLNRLKGGGDQKRVPLLQIAERGLQRVGFGFMMGSATNEAVDSLSSSSSAGAKSDNSECDEEGVSLASTVEKIMKNLRLEITQLKKSLEESRADIEHLQSLTEKQAQKIAESTLYIKDLEERENMLTQNVEEIMMEIAEAEEEVTRWREACELEVEAGKSIVEDRDRENVVLREELEKMKAAMDLSNSKLKLKEELAVAAIAAQQAAERSLRLADSRSAGLHERIEELTRQLDEADRRGERISGRRRVRHMCWPWRALRINPAASRQNPRRRLLPEMEALLHYNI